MAQKRKISIRKVLQALVTLVVTSGCLVAVLGAAKQQKGMKLNEIELHVKNEQQQLFLDKEALWKQIIGQQGIEEKKTLIDQIDVREIEAEASLNPWVSNAQVYIDNERNLHVYVSQRTPAARVFFENGQSFYLDPTLKLLPLSDMFTYYTTIVTNVPVYSNDSLNNDIRGRILKLVRFIDRDSFWSAQIAQFFVTPPGEFELIPVLGSHKIVFGDTARMEAKFNGLFAFYKNVLNRIGWDKYELLDLQYKGQVVASPSIPWKPPSKNALSNMDWVKNIMEAQPKTETATISAATVPSKRTVNTVPPDKPAAAQQAPGKTVLPAKKTATEKATKQKPMPSSKEHQGTESEIISGEHSPETPKYIYKGNGNQ